MELVEIVFSAEQSVDKAALCLFEGEQLLAVYAVVEVGVNAGLHGSAEQIAEYLHVWVVVEFHGLALWKVVDRNPKWVVFVDVADAYALGDMGIVLLNAEFPKIDEPEQFLDAILLALQLQPLSGFVVFIEFDAGIDQLVQQPFGVGFAHTLSSTYILLSSY